MAIKEISPHAKTIISLINNAMTLCCYHHEYKMAREVVMVIKKISKQLGFDIDNEVFEYILDGIVSKNIKTKMIMFFEFSTLIEELEFEMNKENLAGDIKNV